MIQMTDEMSDLVNNNLEYNSPCLLGTVDPEGGPHIGFRGSMMVFDGEHLAYWERTMRGEATYVMSNPRVIVMLRNRERRLGWKFYGTATVLREGPIRQEVMERTVASELDRDPERKGAAVLIKVDLITNIGGAPLQVREGAEWPKDLHG